MAKDKAKDDELFNCSEPHEINYVADLYEESQEVREFLKEKCDSEDIHHSTHKEVYELIQEELGYSLP